MKDVLKFLNEAKWYIIIVIVLTIMVTVLITILINSKNNVVEPRTQEEVMQTLELVDPPVSFLLYTKDDNILSKNNAIEIVNVKEIKNLYKFEDFHKKIDFYINKEILKNKVELLFENY